MSDETEMERRCLCYRCVGDKYLGNEIRRGGKRSACFYCSRTTFTLPLGDIADYIETAFSSHYEMTSSEPDALESAMLRDSEIDYTWIQSGAPVVEAIGCAAGLDERPARDIQEILQERHCDPHLQGEQSEFDEDSHYVRRDPDDWELQADWREFERSLKTEARFFSRAAEAMLDTVFADVGRHRTRKGQSVIVEAGPGKPLSSVFRARVFHHHDRLKEALKRPDKEVGPPPIKLAVAGRMNPRGVSVFYGATVPEVAVADTRTRRQCFGDNLRLLLDRPAVAPIRPRQQFDPPKTVLRVIANFDHNLRSKLLASSKTITSATTPEEGPQGIAYGTRTQGRHWLPVGKAPVP